MSRAREAASERSASRDRRERTLRRERGARGSRRCERSDRRDVERPVAPWIWRRERQRRDARCKTVGRAAGSGRLDCLAPRRAPAHIISAPAAGRLLVDCRRRSAGHPRARSRPVPADRPTARAHRSAGSFLTHLLACRARIGRLEPSRVSRAPSRPPLSRSALLAPLLPLSSSRVACRACVFVAPSRRPAAAACVSQGALRAAGFESEVTFRKLCQCLLQCDELGKLLRRRPAARGNGHEKAVAALLTQFESSSAAHGGGKGDKDGRGGGVDGDNDDDDDVTEEVERGPSRATKRKPSRAASSTGKSKGGGGGASAAASAKAEAAEAAEAADVDDDDK